MGLWTARKVLYRLGVVGLFAGFLLFLVGFCTPFWFHASPGEGSQGLWQYCNGLCHKLEVEEDWFELVRAMLCISLIAYLAACVLAVYDSCLTRYDPLNYKPSRRTEIVTAVAGLVGGSGMAVYTVMMKMQYIEYANNYFGESYGATMGGCCLSFIVAALLTATRARQSQEETQRLTSDKPLVLSYKATLSPTATPPTHYFARTASASSLTETLYPPSEVDPTDVTTDNETFTASTTYPYPAPSAYAAFLHSNSYQAGAAASSAAAAAPAAGGGGFTASAQFHLNYQRPSATDLASGSKAELGLPRVPSCSSRPRTHSLTVAVKPTAPSLYECFD